MKTNTAGNATLNYSIYIKYKKTEVFCLKQAVSHGNGKSSTKLLQGG